MTYICLIFVLYWFPPFLKFGPLPSENPRCVPGEAGQDATWIEMLHSIDTLVYHFTNENAKKTLLLN